MTLNLNLTINLKINLYPNWNLKLESQLGYAKYSTSEYYSDFLIDEIVEFNRLSRKLSVDNLYLINVQLVFKKFVLCHCTSSDHQKNFSEAGESMFFDQSFLKIMLSTFKN